MQRSIIKAIIKALNIVPIPGFWLRGIHKIRTAILIKRVIVPMVKLTFKEIPWAKTLHGEAPVKDTINETANNIMCGRYVVKSPVTKTNKLVKSAIQVEDI